MWRVLAVVPRFLLPRLHQVSKGLFSFSFSNITHQALHVLFCKGVPFKYKKRDSQTDGCPSGYSYYNTACGLPNNIYSGCFSTDPCISASAELASASGEQRSSFRPHEAMRVLFCQGVPLKRTKRAR